MTTVNRNFVVRNGINVNGNATFSNTIAITGSTSLSNTLNVVGNATFSNTVSVTGSATFSNAVAVTGLINSTSLRVTGVSNLAAVSLGDTAADSVAVYGVVNTGVIPLSGNTVTLGNTTNRWGTAWFGNVVVATNTSVNQLSVSGAATLSNSVAIVGNATFSNTISVTGAATFSNNINITGESNSATIRVSGGATLNTVSVNNVALNGVFTTNVLPAGGNTVTLGNTTNRWSTGWFNNINVSSGITVANLTASGTTNINGTINFGNAVTDSITFTGRLATAILPLTNVATDFGASTLRWKDVYSNTVSVSGGAFPVSNTVGTSLGNTTNRWNLNANTINISGNITANGVAGANGQSLISDGSKVYWGTGGSTANSLANGSVSSPAVSFTSDTDTGIFRIADGALGVSLNGVLRAVSNTTYPIYSNGSIFATGDVITASDRSLKTDVVQIADSLYKINNITGVSYTLKSSNEKSLGVIAQEVELVFPELVHKNDDIKSVKYNGLIAVLIEAVKELSAEVDHLKQEIEIIKDR
jgi:hypothetical protein